MAKNYSRLAQSATERDRNASSWDFQLLGPSVDVGPGRSYHAPFPTHSFDRSFLTLWLLWWIFYIDTLYPVDSISHQWFETVSRSQAVCGEIARHYCRPTAWGASSFTTHAEVPSPGPLAVLLQVGRLSLSVSIAGQSTPFLWHKVSRNSNSSLESELSPADVAH